MKRNLITRVILFVLMAALSCTLFPVLSVSAEEEFTNVALGKPVDADSSMESGYFAAQNLTDGKVDAFEGDTNVSLGWLTSPEDEFTSDKYAPISVVIDLGEMYELQKVVLWPMLFGDGYSFPTSYTISVSNNGTDWTPVADDWAINQFTEEFDTTPLEYDISGNSGRYVLFFVEEAGNFKHAGDVLWQSGIGEMEVYGRLPAEETTSAETEPQVTETDPENAAPTEPETTAPAEPETTVEVVGTEEPDTATTAEPATEAETDASTAGGCASSLSLALPASFAVIGLLAWKKRKESF